MTTKSISSVDKYDDGFWDEVNLLLLPEKAEGWPVRPSPERIEHIKQFLARFPESKVAHGSLEEFKRYAVTVVFSLTLPHLISQMKKEQQR
jgi:hypothetical protein